MNIYFVLTCKFSINLILVSNFLLVCNFFRISIHTYYALSFYHSLGMYSFCSKLEFLCGQLFSCPFFLLFFFFMLPLCLPLGSGLYSHCCLLIYVYIRSCKFGVGNETVLQMYVKGLCIYGLQCLINVSSLICAFLSLLLFLLSFFFFFVRKKQASCY